MRTGRGTEGFLYMAGINFESNYTQSALGYGGRSGMPPRHGSECMSGLAVFRVPIVSRKKSRHKGGEEEEEGEI